MVYRWSEGSCCEMNRGSLVPEFAYVEKYSSMKPVSTSPRMKWR